MKKLIFFFFLVVLVIPAFSQDTISGSSSSSSEDYSIRTIFGNRKNSVKIPLGYFLELNGAYTQFAHNKNVFMPGISMGLILDHHWTIGMSGSFIGNHNGIFYRNIYYNEKTGEIAGAHLHGGYGGALFEYTLLPESVVHVSFPLVVGMGYMYYSNEEFHPSDLRYYQNWHHSTIDNDYFFVVEPGIKAEFNVVKALRIGVGISYRYTPDLELKHTPDDLVNQFNASLSFRIGKF
jgi:hypothetical protein